MDLCVADVAKLLNVNETTIEKWVKQGKIPSYNLNDKILFSKLEIEEWMLSRKHETTQFIKELESEKLQKLDNQGRLQFVFYRAIFKGGVFADIEGETKQEIIQNTMQHIAQPFGLDAQVLTDLLLDREKLMPTSVGNGMAIPHTRDLNKLPHDIVITVFPKNPIKYGALDKKPVHTLFFLFACNDKNHLNLLSKIAYLALDKKALELLQSKPSQKELLEYIKTWESAF
ncbi:MAG: Nitrogen regulatory protein [Chlamydiae bacterium]|nr:Nitrogen regulatory protein [Chlamydiota bacterium]